MFLCNEGGKTLQLLLSTRPEPAEDDPLLYRKEPKAVQAVWRERVELLIELLGGILRTCSGITTPCTFSV